MKKFLYTTCFLLLGVIHAEALVCVDLPNNLVKGKENSEVFMLQNFLVQKGFLKATPNGYFGNGTVLAVKKYQESVGLSRSGQAFPLTRSLIKKETCTTLTTSSTNKTTITAVAPNTTNVSKVETNVAVQNTPAKPLAANDQRQADVISILQASYSYYLQTGVFVTPISTSSPFEICASDTSLCTGFEKVKQSVVPSFLSKLPIDPSVVLLKAPEYTVTRSENGGVTITDPTLTVQKSGYFIARSNEGLVTVTAPKSTGAQNIFAKCNFFNKCSVVTAAIEASSTEKNLHIASIDKATFIYGGSMDAPLVIRGTGFTAASNTIIFTAQDTRMRYIIGTFPSSDLLTINATSSFTYSPLPCAQTCSLRLPTGEYDVTVKNAWGESNAGFISIKDVITQTTPNSPDKAFLPKSTHVKLATITLSSTVPMNLKGLNLQLNTPDGSLNDLTKKITRYTLTDVMADKVINGGPNFVFNNDVINGSQFKTYELYVDIADMDFNMSGQINFKGQFLMKGITSTSTVAVPIKDFMITVSY